ncbi:CAP domain-containing protein [Butyricicoccus sp. AM18-35]|nr:CAP domain-containing protein [Butyricicoccus sp. AM18-35]
MKCKKIMPLALALAIASTVSAGAARLPQSGFSFPFRPGYTQTVSRPSQSAQPNSSYAVQVVSLVNAERAKQGLSALTVSTKVQQAAQTRAGELKSSFSHTRPSGASCFTALTEAGVPYTRAGENIAYGQSTPEAVVQSWMNSSGHRANILSSSFTSIGVGCTVVNGTAYWAQLFTA